MLCFQLIRCSFETSSYFTWATTSKVYQSLFCANDGVCNWGENCHSDFSDVPSLNILRINSSVSGCQLVTPTFLSNDSCLHFYSRACLMYIVNVTPVLKTTHEVKRIAGYSCDPVIRVGIFGDRLNDDFVLVSGFF